MKDVLIKMGGVVGTRTIYFKKPFGSLPREQNKKSNVWVSGDYYDFIHVIPHNLNGNDVKKLMSLLGIDSLPARHPLRRVLARMIIRDQITVKEFYEIIRPSKKPVIKKEIKVKNEWAPVDEDEINMLLHEIKTKESDFEKDQTQRRIWLKQAYHRMRVPVPNWIDDVIIHDYTSFDQIPNLGLWFRTKSNRGRYLLLDSRLFEIASNYISNLGFVVGFFTKQRRSVNNDGGALYIMDNCRYENTDELINLLKESL